MQLVSYLGQFLGYSRQEETDTEEETNTLEPGGVLSLCLENQAISPNERINAYGDQGYHGLSKDLSKKLGRGDYIPVLKSLWSEPDPTKRLTWLRDNAELHVPLMLERAILEVKHGSTSTIDIIFNVSLPLIEAALFRIKQDFSCCNERKDTLSPFVKDTYEKVVYESLLGKINEANIPERLNKIKQKVIEVAQETLTKLENGTLVPPNWIANRPQGKIPLQMHPEDQWLERRKRVAQDTIKK